MDSTTNQTKWSACEQSYFSLYLFRWTQKDKSFFRLLCSCGHEYIWTSAAFLTFLQGGAAFLASPVLIIIELVDECWCWETYSGCCSPRSRAVTPRERERRGRESQRAKSWMNKPTHVIFDFTATQWCYLTESSDALTSLRQRSASFLKAFCDAEGREQQRSLLIH